VVIALMTPQPHPRHNALEDPRERRELDARFDLRQTRARQEFARWRESNPNFTTQELLTAWRQIRRAWGLCPPPKTRKP